MSTPTLHLGAIFHLHDDPRNGPEAIEWLPQGALLVEDGFVVAVGDAAKIQAPAEALVRTHNGIITPGFIDAHVHYPQTDMIAAYGMQLMDWLANYTYPTEAAFADAQHAADVAKAFLDELLRNAVTTAVVFATSHVAATEALFAEADKRRMRIIAGKVLMDQHAPPALLDAPGGGVDETEALIKKWHGKGRLLYAVTPRFALTSSPAQMEAAGKIVDARADIYLHTHLAENRQEIETVLAHVEGARDYLHAYERHGMVRPRSIFAHAIHMPEDGMQRIAQADAAIAFCPSSNLFLGSGFFDLAGAREAGAHVCLGTDVGAGTSFSMLSTMGEAYKVCQARGAPLDAFQAFYLATLGGARGLKLEDRLGNFAPGKEADFAVLDPNATPLLARRAAASASLHEMLFALMILGDDRAVAETWVAGELAHVRTDFHPTPTQGAAWKRKTR